MLKFVNNPSIRLRFLYLLLALLLVSTASFGQQALTDKLPVDPNVKVGTLKNGLTYYIRKNSRPEKKVELRLVVNVGSIMEDADQLGLAHFNEHMAFNGTKNFAKNELVSFLQSIGVEFGADLNAYTTFDETVYILPIPTDKPGNLEKGFQILEDWASNITLDDEEIDKERGVVLEELRLGKGADDRMRKIYWPHVFENSLYAERWIGGNDESIKTFKHDVLKRFYKDWYRPNLMAVVAVGDIDPAEAEKMVKSYFGKLKNPRKARTRSYASVPPRSKSEAMVVTDKEATNVVVYVLYSSKKSKQQSTLQDYRRNIIDQLFSTMLNQRLQELTQKAEPPFVYAGSGKAGLARGYETYQAISVPGQEGVKAAVESVIQENERARKFGFTGSELELVKKSVLRNIERAYNERAKSDSENYAAEYIRAFLEDEPIPGIENEYKYYNDMVPSITLEEINKYAAETIPSIGDSKLILLLGPEESPFELPTNEELLAMANDAAKAEIKPYEDKAVASSLMTTPPAAGKIVNEITNQQLGTTELQLGNGARVILKSTDFKNDQVVLTATRFGGQYLFDNKDRTNAEYASTIVGQMGVGDFTPLDLKKVLAGKTVNVGPRLGSYTEGFSGQCGSKDVEPMLQLLNLYVTAPRKDEELFKAYVSSQKTLYQNLMSNPNAAYQDDLIKVIYGEHPRAPKLPAPEDFDNIDIDRALEIYQERFGSVAGFTFILVGSFDTDAIKPLIAAYIGSLPGKPVTTEVHDVGLRPVKGVVKKDFHHGQEEKSSITISFFGEAPYSSAENFKIDFLTEVLNITVIETLREDMSGVYGAGVYGGLRKYPYNNYSLTVSMPCGPENVDKLVAASFAEIEKIKKNGPKEADMNKVKETMKQQYEVNIKENGYWARALQSSVESGAPAENILDFEKRLNAITAKQIQDTAIKYFDMKNYVQAVLYPEK